MKKIILLRHAKSSWAEPSLDDHDRPLNRRGRGAAPVIGAWLARSGHLPDTVLCSSSVRTRETLDLIGQYLPAEAERLFEDDLYHALPPTLLSRLRDLPRTCFTVLVVGHQPGLGSLTRLLSDGTAKRRCRRAFEHFPTAAAAVLEAEIEDWGKLAFGEARFIDFAKPRELAEAGPWDQPMNAPDIATSAVTTAAG